MPSSAQALATMPLALCLTKTFTLPFSNWLAINLRSSKNVWMGFVWQRFFATTLRLLWKWWCSSLFQTQFQRPLRPVDQISPHLHEWEIANDNDSIPTTGAMVTIGWLSPQRLHQIMSKWTQMQVAHLMVVLLWADYFRIGRAVGLWDTLNSLVPVMYNLLAWTLWL